jgi:glycosyltransferase involved in cell wall biosynthesis
VKIVAFLNQLGIGGVEKAACRWARALHERGHEIQVLTLADGLRRGELEANNINVTVAADRTSIQKLLKRLEPDVIHVHAPGHPHQGDVLGEVLATIPKIPIVQTNIFGQLDNPKENAWTDFRLFISWTSCVQAARRYFLPLNENFFRHASAAIYPLDADDGPNFLEVENFRRSLGVQPDQFLLGRLSRPEPNKWTDLPIEAFRLAARQDSRLKLLLREPPVAVRHNLETAGDRDRFIVLPATSDSGELARTMASLDVVLHTSIMGESFGYGIAEPMNFGKPVIANSTPWLDQAQIELVRQGECGFIASTPHSVAEAILTLANNPDLRTKFGSTARSHIRKLADPNESTDRLESALNAAVAGENNPRASADLAKAQAAADYLDKQQFGHSWREQLALRLPYYRARFHQLRKAFGFPLTQALSVAQNRRLL